ncbi:CRC domain [Dillenia turbinata]|uniref:CRC domain n=1 Tax=Dillenia turbinata TaxID=194707 RepID=A0AAN8U8C5_9MAGN
MMVTISMSGSNDDKRLKVSPSFASLSDLSPPKYNTLKGFSNIDLPNSYQVFGSPQPNPRPRTSLLNRTDTSAAGSNVCEQHESHSCLGQSPCFEDEVLSCSPSAFLVDSAGMVECPNLGPHLGNSAGEDGDGGRKQGASNSFMKHDIFKSFDQNVADCTGPSSGGQQSQSFSMERLQNADLIEEWIKAVDSFPDPPWTVEGCENHNEKGQVEETSQQLCSGSRRHLQFSTAQEFQITSIGDIEDPNNMGTRTASELGNLASFQNNSRLTSCSQPLNAFPNLLSSKTYFSHGNTMKSNPNNTNTFTPGIGLHLNKFGHGVVSINPDLPNINATESTEMQERKNAFVSGIGLHLNKVGTQVPTSPGSTDKQKDKALSDSHRSLIESPSTHSIPGRSGANLSSMDNNNSTEAVLEASTYLLPSSCLKGQDYSLDFSHLPEEKTLCFQGNYCSDDCSCTNCFNKQDYEDTVLDSKQQIVQRNPFAFVPRRLIYNQEPAANILEEEQTVLAPAMPRKGCNCKKSRCLKKYCDCYQAGVGCSEACRCEDCKNPNGANLAAATSGRLEDHFNGKLNIPHKPIFNDGQPSSSRFVPLNREFNATGSYQVSQIWENLVDLNQCHQPPLAHYSSGLMASSSCMPITQENLQPAEAQFWEQSELLSFDPCGSSISLVPPQSSPSANHFELFYNNSPFNLSTNNDTTVGRKTTSPQKKYISAPYQPAQVLGSSCSTGLKSGRRYILQGVLSHPWPSPHSDLSKGVNQ